MCKIYEIEIPVKGVTFREQAVKNACDAIANYNNVIDKDDYYGARTYYEIKNDLISMEQQHGHAYIYKYDDMTFSDIKLIPEPNNRQDPNAIKILIFGYHVGYVPKEKTLFLKRYMNNDNYIINKVGKIVGGPFIVWISSKIIIGIGYLTMMMIGGFFGAFFSALKESSKS